MKEFKLNREKKDTLPDDKVINKYKSFDNLRAKYDDVVKPSPMPLYKNRKFFLLLILIVLTAWLIAESIEKEKSENNQENIEATE